MKKMQKRITWILLILAALYLLLNAALLAFGKAIIISQIEKNLKTKVSLEKVTFGLPLSINVDKLNIEGLLKADSISVSPSILGFLAGRIVLSDLKLIQPEITLTKSADGELNLPQFAAKGKQPPFLLVGLKIKDGKFIFVDKKLDPDGYRVVVDKINLNISKVAFPPTSLYANFKASAVLVNGANKPAGQAAASGWIDFGPKNMDGKFELKDVEAAVLAPYYKNIVPGKKLGSAKLNFSADLKAKSNDLLAKCHLEFSNVAYEKEAEEQDKKQTIDIFSEALGIFSDASGKLTFDFSINTKLDNPRLDLINLKGSIAQAAVQNIAGQPSEDVIEKVKETAKKFKELGKGLKDIFKKEE
jgi:hypothetical protein